MIYEAVRDWVDRQWRGPGLQFKILIVPAVTPAFSGIWLDRTMALDVVVLGWFAIWTSFVAWRYWVYMREVAIKADLQYDRAGKFELASEYHGTESATAARSGKKVKND